MNRKTRMRLRLLAGTEIPVAAMVGFAVLPWLWMMLSSIRPERDLTTTPIVLMPHTLTMATHIELLQRTSFASSLRDSLIVACGAVALGLAVAVPAAYAFSRFRFPGSKLGLMLLLGTQMIPASMMILPLFLMIVRLGLINTYLGMIIAYSVSSLPFSIWLLKGYYDTVPRSLEEAALVDGTTRFGAFYRIVLPLSTPALAIAFLFNFTTAWNEYLVARVVLSDSGMYTWTLGLFELQGQYLTQWGMFAAGSFLVTIPVLCVFLFTSKWMVSGLTMGGVKG